jgi:hypothetical protein
LDSSILPTDNDGLQELVSLVLFISLLDSLQGVAALLPLPTDDSLQSDFNTVPPFIAVHDEVSADYRRNLSHPNLLGLLDELFQMTSTRFWIGITTITEEMDKDLRYSDFLGDFEQGVEVFLVRML